MRGRLLEFIRAGGNFENHFAFVLDVERRLESRIVAHFGDSFFYFLDFRLAKSLRNEAALAKLNELVPYGVVTLIALRRLRVVISMPRIVQMPAAFSFLMSSMFCSNKAPVTKTPFVKN